MLRAFDPRDQPAVRRLILDGMRERWKEQYVPSANPDVDDMCHVRPPPPCSPPHE